MSNFALQTKRMLITTLKKGESTGHPKYIEKSIAVQLWERVKPVLIFAAGLAIGWVVG